MKITDLKKQGKGKKNLWIIGTLLVNDTLEINSLFNTNLTDEVDLTKSYEVKKVKITKSYNNGTTSYFFDLVF